METISGAWGGRADADGLDCASNVTGLQSNTPVEVLETEYPIEVVQYGFVPDSGGAGKHRGGLSLLREYRYLADRGHAADPRRPRPLRALRPVRRTARRPQRQLARSVRHERAARSPR